MVSTGGRSTWGKQDVLSWEEKEQVRILGRVGRRWCETGSIAEASSINTKMIMLVAKSH